MGTLSKLQELPELLKRNDVLLAYNQITRYKYDTFTRED